MSIRSKGLLLTQAALLPLTAMLAVPAMAQDNAQAEASDDSGNRIVVTARKREEDLIDIPLAITAFSEDAIEDAAFSGLEDISLQSSGFQFSNQGGQQPGRYNTQLRFRGMSTAQFSPTFATGALFIDGVYVLNGGTSNSLVDVERVEVIKGPQSAYFGRNTFGGAVNFITRNPSLTELNGQVEGSMTDRQTFDLSGIIEVPIIEDKMSFSLSGRFYDKRGHYVANDGGRLGNEQTVALNGVLYMEPTEGLSIKLRASYSEDSDGAPAAGFISGRLNDTCSGTTITTGAGETAMPVNYICGELPGIDEVISENVGNFISGSTTIDPGFLANLNGATVSPGLPDIQRIGLERRTERYSAKISYEFESGYFIDVLGSYNKQGANWIRDFDLTDNYGWLSRDPQAIEDYSGELRFTSPQDKRLRYLVGVNYYSQTFSSSGAGGDAGTGCFVFFQTFDFNNCAFPLFFPNSFAGNDESEVLGFFAALDFDLTDQFTISLEGRYQDDTLTKGGSLTNDGVAANATSLESKSFLPRVILRYQPGPSTNIYASFAKGILQGDINTEVANADARELAQYEAAIPGVAAAIDVEKINAWEVGIKQGLFDDNIQLNLAAYYYEWSNIKGRSSVLVNETCDADKFGETGCDPADGIMLGDPAAVSDGLGGFTPFSNSRNVLIPGDAKLWGVELEAFGQITPNLFSQLNITWAKNEYQDYEFNFVAPFAGFSNMRGNSQPRFPEWSGNFSSTYTAELTNDFDWFLRGDVIYFGEAFIDESNLAFSEDYFLVNARIGVQSDDLRFEIFARNLFDEDAWAAAARWTDFSTPTFFNTLTAFQGAAVSPQDRRQFGLRAIFDF